MKRPYPKAEYVQRNEHTTDEQVEQTMRFGEAIMLAVQLVCEDHQQEDKRIHLSALLGALISVLAHHIAGIPDEEDRQQQYRRIGTELAAMITTNVELGAHAIMLDEEEHLQ